MMIKLYSTRPPIDTGLPNLDLLLTTVVFVALSYSVASIITALNSARTSLRARSSRNLGRYLAARNRARIFIVLGLLSLAIVTWHRFKHLDLPVPSAKELAAWAEDTASLLPGVEAKKRHIWDHIPGDRNDAASSFSSAASVASASLSSGASSLYEEARSAAPPMTQVTSFAAHAAASLLSAGGVAASVAGEGMEAVGSKIVHYAEHGASAVASDASRAEKAAQQTMAPGWRRILRYMRASGDGMMRGGKRGADMVAEGLKKRAEGVREEADAVWKGERKIEERVVGTSKWVREALYGRASLRDLSKSLLSDSRRF